MNGAGTALDAESCNMECTGDGVSPCGGSWALTTFKFDNNTNTSASVASPSSTSNLDGPGASTSEPSAQLLGRRAFRPRYTGAL